MDPFLGEIRLFACSYAPNGWALCAGQLLSTRSFSALYSLLGVTYGGNGSSTFALPNLGGSVVVGPGQGPGLSAYTQGQAFGVANVMLTPSQMAAHPHTLPCGGTGVEDSLPSPSTFLSAAPGSGGPHAPPGAPLYTTATQQSATSVTMAPREADAAGGSEAHNNMSPYLTLNYCIALQGNFPQRQ